MAGREGDLFIVDNSDGGWTGLRYLEEWTAIARSFDIATGYFDIGALLGLDGKWQGLEKIRILMGADTTQRTRGVIRVGVSNRAVGVLTESLENRKSSDPFLTGVPSIVAALRSRQIEVRIYDKDKFHAKAYITHSKLEVVGKQALVGSSNFTTPGLTKNVELNIRIENSNDVEDLQHWFESYWAEATDTTDLVIDVVERHTRLYSPFDVYAKALQEFFRGHAATADEFDQTESRMFPRLDLYQKEAYWAMLKIARQHGGAFLCDGVGLGKTFVGLMLIERLVMHEGKRVVLLAPKGAREGVWDPHLRDYLPHIGGPGRADFSTLAVFNHTDLSRGGEYPERFANVARMADVVVVDEAHHFRNTGRRGVEEGGDPSRYYRLFELLDPEARPKTLFMLTATPINNRLSDFRHMVELFSRRDEGYFKGSLGVPNLRAHFNVMEKDLQRRLTLSTQAALPEEPAMARDLTDDVVDAQTALGTSPIFSGLVVQRSRAYARDSQILEGGTAASFPTRNDPKVARYSIKKTYGDLLGIFERAFEKRDPLFTLPMYYPLHWYRGANAAIDPFEENRQKQVVGLIRTQFLKRFESSVAAFEISCDRLLKKLLAFVDVHSETADEQRRLERWRRQNEALLKYANTLQLDFWSREGPEDEGDEDEDVVPPELLEKVVHLDRRDYDVPEMLAETFLDLDEIVKFLAETRRFKPEHDDKLQRLLSLMKTKTVADHKILIFTEFADTARYIAAHLANPNTGITGVAQIDSASRLNRAEVIQRFAPYYNRSSSAELATSRREEIRVLVSTDVLSEGLNLQDATRMINYDIHWNPVRLMQRIGRVDRRLNPDIEERLVRDHPSLKKTRGIVDYWNFLPPDELNDILSLYTTVTRKTLLISKTLGIETGKLLRPEDDFEVLREFNHTYEGTKSAVEEMLLEYRALLVADEGLEARLMAFPGSVFSARERVSEGLHGVFFCYSLPALDRDKDEFTEEAGTTQWYFLDVGGDQVLEEPSEIVKNIRSHPTTHRKTVVGQGVLIDARRRVERHITDSYLKRVDATQGVKPVLKCWMELNER